MDETLYNYRLNIAYDGTAYHGWQIQPNGVTIQQKIEQVLTILAKQPIKVIGSGRTDAGVHALAQVAHFRSLHKLDCHRVCHGLNALLPTDIRVMELDAAPPEFHAQYSAKGKVYHYHLHLDRVQNPFKRFYSLHVLHRLDLGLLKEAASFFVGTHDFVAFANHNMEGSAAHDSIRTLTRVDVVEEEGGVRLEFEGDGFLYKMVRTIVGTLLEIARGKRAIEDIPAIFASKDRRRAGVAVLPHGLFLIKVLY